VLYPSFPRTNALVGDWYNQALYGTVLLFGYFFALDERIVAATQRLRWRALADTLFCYDLHPLAGATPRWSAAH
jgi:hypothetical protein